MIAFFPLPTNHSTKVGLQIYIHETNGHHRYSLTIIWKFIKFDKKVKKKKKIQGIETCSKNSHLTFIYSNLNNIFSIVWNNLKIQESETLSSIDFRSEYDREQIILTKLENEIISFLTVFVLHPAKVKLFFGFLDPHCVPLPVPQSDPNFSCTSVISQNLI